MEYAIIDIETTGLSGAGNNKITEIALVVHNGLKIIEEYHSLVNPQTGISKYVTGLTGIDASMVKNAPTFSEIADDILKLTENRIFVAHNVSFDYNVIKKEFEGLGKNFNRKRLCTVRLARKLFPGFKSYSLGNLCKQLEIAIKDRHRAKGDTDATVLLFERLLEKDCDNIIKHQIKANSGETNLPPLLSRITYDLLPDSHGVYYFKNQQGEIIYVGKAKNIKKRVLGHFYDKSAHEISLCKEIAEITCEVTGNELIALLLESSAIKKHYPPYNRAQKKINKGYGIVSYTNRNGIKQLGYLNSKQCVNPIFTTYSITEAKAFLEMLCERFCLCPKFTHLQPNAKKCSHFKIVNCKGICIGEEDAASYNERVCEAIRFTEEIRDNLLIFEKGRTNAEAAFVLVKDGVYKGYGYLPLEKRMNSIEELQPFLQLQSDSSDTKRILAAYIRKYPENIKFLDGQTTF